MVDVSKLAREFGVSICVAVSELPDRTSPDAWPEAMLVTASELSAIVERELADQFPDIGKMVNLADERRIAFESGADQASYTLAGDIIALKAEVESLRAEAKQFDDDHAAQNRMVDRIADLIGLPHDLELDTTAFELWFSAEVSALRAKADALAEALANILGGCVGAPVGAGDGNTRAVYPPSGQAIRQGCYALAAYRESGK
jgi:hypothetical protein